MAENELPAKKGFSADWLIRGVLTRIGDTFDRITGRGWKPSSSLATSELIERLKLLLDTEATEDETGRRFVPHNIRLKMQWDKFSTDSDESLRKLEEEFLTATVDHINDRHYYTLAPLSVVIKPDYFTQGVKLFVSFEKFADEECEAAVHVPVPGAVEADAGSAPEPSARFTVFVRFQARSGERQLTFDLAPGDRLGIGRTKQNDITLDDESVSKIHASLSLTDAGGVVVSDTGSTNGTFINGERIAYGKAHDLAPDDVLKIGLVELYIRVEPFAGSAVDDVPHTFSSTVDELDVPPVGPAEQPFPDTTSTEIDAAEFVDTQPTDPGGDSPAD